MKFSYSPGVQSSPKVLSANITQQNALLVSWSAGSNGVILYTIVTTINKRNGVEISYFVSSEKMEVSLPINGSDDLYDVKVTVVDGCGENISSEYLVTRNTSRLLTSVTPITTVLVQNTNGYCEKTGIL